MTTIPTLPALRPTARHKAYYDELRTLQARHGAAILADVAAIKAERGSLKLGDALGLALRYRLKLAALFAILEDGRAVPVGTYDRLKESRFVGYADGTEGRFAPMRLLAEHIAAHGLPAPAPGCEEAS